MRHLKYKYLLTTAYVVPIIIAVIILILASTGGIFYYITQLPSGGKTEGVADCKEYRKIDKLFTAFAYIPLVKYKKGYLKREILTKKIFGKEKEAMMGYCFRQYEIGIGYDQVSNLFPQYQKVACQGNFKFLPVPKILSTNPVSSKVLGTYLQQECDSLDIGSLDDRESHQLITSELAGEQWQEIVNNSQKILMTFMQIYCPEAEERRAE
ncbi:MAG: hypothetical protein J7L96_05100 [Bacteroidales bacterium]|nr:hypothetical protein [Bacteroidales bacterium]